MDKKNFDRLLESVTQAKEIMTGEREPSRRFVFEESKDEDDQSASECCEQSSGSFGRDAVLKAAHLFVQVFKVYFNPKRMPVAQRFTIGNSFRQISFLLSGIFYCNCRLFHFSPS